MKKQPEPELPFPPPRRFIPEILAKAAVARKPTTPSGHRVKFTLTLFLRRETAEALSGLAVLHYDGDFDVISRVTGQPCEWVVPSGTLD
jgi:hypothetical protein